MASMNSMMEQLVKSTTAGVRKGAHRSALVNHSIPLQIEKEENKYTAQANDLAAHTMNNTKQHVTPCIMVAI